MASSISLSLRFLLMTWRSLSVPASGTKVNPVFLTLIMFLATFEDNPLGRKEDSEREIFCFSSSVIKVSTISQR